MSVDDLAVVATLTETAKVKEELLMEFVLSDLGPGQWLLGVNIVRGWVHRKILRTLPSYIDSTLDHHGMPVTGCNPVQTPLTGPAEPTLH